MPHRPPPLDGWRQLCRRRIRALQSRSVSLLPRRVKSLLAGGKDMGTTHITNGCYRLHPVRVERRRSRRPSCRPLPPTTGSRRTQVQADDALLTTISSHRLYAEGHLDPLARRAWPLRTNSCHLQRRKQNDKASTENPRPATSPASSWALPSPPAQLGPGRSQSAHDHLERQRGATWPVQRHRRGLQAKQPRRARSTFESLPFENYTTTLTTQIAGGNRPTWPGSSRPPPSTSSAPAHCRR